MWVQNSLSRYSYPFVQSQIFNVNLINNYLSIEAGDSVKISTK